MATVEQIKNKYCADKSLAELERSYKMGLGSQAQRKLFEKVNTPENNKTAQKRTTSLHMSRMRNPDFSKSDTALKNDKGFVNMYKQAKDEIKRVSFAITGLEETSTGDKGLSAAAKKIRDALATYSRLLEQKGKGAISVR